MTEPTPCPVTEGVRVCAYAVGHEDRGFNHRFVYPEK